MLAFAEDLARSSVRLVDQANPELGNTMVRSGLAQFDG